MVKTKYKCVKCGYLFSAKGGNFKKHFTSCDGSYKPFVKSTRCKHCNKLFTTETSSQRANHTRWCDKNPKKEMYLQNFIQVKSQITSESKFKQIEAIKLAHTSGKYIGSAAKAAATKKRNGTNFHTQETKELIRKKALSSPHRRLKKSMVLYNGVLLDSSWELELAKRLDNLKIQWIRPRPLPWVDEYGVTHNYFPDFYLKDYDLFLDPKNPHAKKIQKKKLDMLFEQYKNIIILDTIEACKNFKI